MKLSHVTSKIIHLCVFLALSVSKTKIDGYIETVRDTPVFHADDHEIFINNLRAVAQDTRHNLDCTESFLLVKMCFGTTMINNGFLHGIQNVFRRYETSYLLTCWTFSSVSRTFPINRCASSLYLY